jgi:hypothetical protein
MKDGEHCSDIELLLAARTSAEAFGVFYERHFPSVLTFFRRLETTIRGSSGSSLPRAHH